MHISRRRGLKLAAGAMVTPALATWAGSASAAPQLGRSAVSLSPDEEPSADDLRQMQLDAMVTEDGANGADGAFNWQNYSLDHELRALIRRQRVVPRIVDGQLNAEPVADALSPNYNHLGGLGSPGATFMVNDALLTRMAAANGFQTSFATPLTGGAQPQNRIVIFGLRGAKLAPNAAPRIMSDAIELTEAEVDHRNKNCIMGVWDRQTKQVSAFTASTVPHLMYMQMFRINLHLLGDITLNDATFKPDDVISEEEKTKRRKSLAWTANQLAQGLHLMQVGTHQGKYKDLLVQHMTWCGPVMRAKDGLAYTVKTWDRRKGRVGDNIHPCWAVDGVDFSSAGCNLIEGQSKKSPGYGGPFADFLKQVRIVGEAGAAAGDTKTYYYMLLSGREARMHAHSAATFDPALKRLRFGSTGVDVTNLQADVLGFPAAQATGVFDFATHSAVLKWQLENRFAEDGVVTPKLLA